MSVLKTLKLKWWIQMYESQNSGASWTNSGWNSKHTLYSAHQLPRNIISSADLLPQGCLSLGVASKATKKIKKGTFFDAFARRERCGCQHQYQNNDWFFFCYCCTIICLLNPITNFTLSFGNMNLHKSSITSYLNIGMAWHSSATIHVIFGVLGCFNHWKNVPSTHRHCLNIL